MAKLKKNPTLTRENYEQQQTKNHEVKDITK